jgi:hypothetical protein
VITEIRIYYEGDRLLKPGFHEFFAPLRKLARERRCAFQLIQGGSGPSACRDFGIALRTNPHAWNVLLVDSEGPDTGTLGKKLCEAQGWPETHSDSIFWMVEMMESWFHADRDALEKFYGQQFRRSALKANREKVRKAAPNCKRLFTEVLAKLG